MCTCSVASRAMEGILPRLHSQQTPPGILCSALGFPACETHGHVRVAPDQVRELDHLSFGGRLRVGTAQPEEKAALRRSKSNCVFFYT